MGLEGTIVGVLPRELHLSFVLARPFFQPLQNILGCPLQLLRCKPHSSVGIVEILAILSFKVVESRLYLLKPRLLVVCKPEAAVDVSEIRLFDETQCLGIQPQGLSLLVDGINKFKNVLPHRLVDATFVYDGA